ncbi:MAG: chemotaxis protein [Rhodospirillaceae bacterium]|nr:MAG: chemotaxis protein [Rhodospirillaceae bacterium]
MARDLTLTGVERTFDSSDIIVSKTDLKGRMTYVNDTFLKMAGYTIDECIGEPHSKIRHPDMPRCVFKLLWDTIAKGYEIFAYVINRSNNGDHYWVLAHVTATMAEDGTTITGYHSSRRSPSTAAISAIKPIYAKLKAEEDRHSNAKEGMAASTAMLVGILTDAGISYDEFVFSVINAS